MRRAACAVLSLCLWACGPDSLPSPSIVSVVPERVFQGGSSALAVKVSAVQPLSVDYEAQSATPAQLAMTVQLGGQTVEIPFAEADGTLFVPVPMGLALGSHDIRVALADGREVIREHGFTVVPASPLSEKPQDGERPDEDGSGDPWGNMQEGLGFQIDSIGEQVRSVPFQISLRATWPGAHSFQGPVSLRVSRGQVLSITPGTFSEGVRTEEISVSHPGAQLYLMVEDAHGHKGLSNPFRVRPF
jgi:hypothetical protein